MNIRLKGIDESSWKECVKLEVDESQRAFVPSNLYSIAESKFEENMRLFGVYRNDIMIGFASYILDDDGDMNISRLMIDKHHQGKGYGKEALSKLMDILKPEAEKKEVWVGVHPDNTAAIKLYSNYGFYKEITGFEDEAEIFLKYDILI